MNQKEFKMLYDETIRDLHAKMSAFPWEARGAYANWCSQTYHYVCHSTRLLAMSAALLPLEQTKMHHRFVKHIKEEAGHEVLAKMDLEHVGHKLPQFPEMSATRSFYQTQYYLIQNVHPLALFGYIFLLEGGSTSVGPECYKRVCKAHGDKAGNFWRVHSEEDPDHIHQAFAHIADADNKTLDLIALNMTDSSDRYVGLLNDIKMMDLVKNRAA